MSNPLGILHGFFPRHTHTWMTQVGAALLWEGPGFQLAFTSPGLEWLLRNTCHHAAIKPGLGAVTPPTEPWALRSWILIPSHGTGVQVGQRACDEKPNASRSPPTAACLTNPQERLQQSPGPTVLATVLCYVCWVLGGRPCTTLGMSCTGACRLGWGLTTRVMA